MKLNTSILTLILALGMNPSAKAAVIAVIDSGTDLQHKDLANKTTTTDTLMT